MRRARVAAIAALALALGALERPPSGAAEKDSRSFTVLEPLMLAPGVSGREEKVREAILRLLPAWARQSATVDGSGNLLVRTGSGGERILFIAHMDETGYEITGLEADGTARVKSLGGFFATLYEAQRVVVHTRAGELAAIVRPRSDYLDARSAAAPFLEKDLTVDFGTSTLEETRQLGVSRGDWITIPKIFRRLAGDRATGRSVDDRAGCTALVQAIGRLDPKSLKNRVTFAWSVQEEIGLKGAEAIAAHDPFDVVFAVDTFVSSDSPLETPAFADAILGEGPVLRAMDNSNLAPEAGLEKVERIAAARKLPLQIGLTHGGNDGSVFPPYGAIDIPLSWPTTYSHSPVEVIHQRDLDNLGRLVAILAEEW
ncbi:MAG TPA: M28 family peptidase [Candidatus Polarisedimenticolia bacterium]|nr:M28 family peptidase [Candidatus Polarisedimenticolia bacterium]